MADINIEGNLGFFAIYGETNAGKSWVDRHVQGAGGGVAYSDQRNLVREIADAAVDDGLTVHVNEQPYTGSGR